ncbi:class I SAM-dependent methyltransferase [Alicyclobacillus dauci]|uniref:Class I SAM-dependent methyltransferase n=1 Tax=Alicyclobacillus dauci TaxID=1475485 RepID=A0ABY6YYF1_9BACL|nr:class I SAM-dependent methyltransferase [Alicyclobacillus dauci]WAH35323.1 class I SAM-dependent methyltransferase [Alicyclobacillus dauci]
MSDLSPHLDVTHLQAVATTPRNRTPADVGLAQELAKWFSVPYVARDDRSLAQMFTDTGAEVMIIAGQPVKLLHRDATHPLFFHPSMAAQRIERMARGEEDRLLRVADVRRGDTVVDATMGLGSDALVFAHGVGIAGKVIGCEQSPLVARLLTAMQWVPNAYYGEAVDLLKRVTIIAEHHLQWLSKQPADSVDIVYFDPMFRSPAEESAGLAPLRSFAVAEPLRAESVAQAKRVARRCVVVRERPFSGVFQMYGLKADNPKRKIAYGVWRKYDD